MKTTDLVLTAACLVSLSACHAPAHRKSPDRFDLPDSGWATLAIDGPGLFFMEEGRPKIVISCKDNALGIQVRDMAPAQAFPQPHLTMKVLVDSWDMVPDAKLIGGQSALQADFTILESGMRDKSTMAAIGKGVAPTITFNGVTKSFPPIPLSNAEEFRGYCLKRWQLPS
ncbi:MAG: hypothetical protein JWM33_2402 [Caulobacteraceae bacterium]|nr:hypothetical protein [Caulobacteraceae bacterium]